MSGRVLGVDHIVPGREPELLYLRVERIDDETVALVLDGDLGQLLAAPQELRLALDEADAA